MKWLLTWDAAFNVVFGPAPLAVEVTEAFVLPKFLPAIANTTWAVTRHACDLTYFVSEMVTDVWDAPVVAFFVFRDGKLSPVGGARVCTNALLTNRYVVNALSQGLYHPLWGRPSQSQKTMAKGPYHHFLLPLHVRIAAGGKMCCFSLLQVRQVG